MCGIHGFIDPAGQAAQNSETIRKMVASTEHRGPDNQGFYENQPVFLGHNRLSIIDLSETAHQPMISGRHVIVFNGEIYNYREIRAELTDLGHTFNTSSDTEVILKAYEQYGPSCVDSFVGMWAFAIYDTKSGTLFCSRDRFGIKPLYYLQQGRALYFASELKSLRKCPYFSSELNLDQVSRGLQLGWIGYADETYFRQARSLKPGHNLLFTDGKIQITRYWDIAEKRKIANADREQAAHFGELFQESLSLHMRSDVPVGATLSGGIDSSSIVSSIIERKLAKDLNTFSIYYEGSDAVDEREFVYEIEKKYPGEFSLYYGSPGNQELEADFHHIAETMDFPLSGSSPVSQYYVMKLIAQHGIKVVLSGQGADDYLGGYMHGYYRFFAEKLVRGQLGTLAREMGRYRKRQHASAGKMTDVLLKTGLSVVMNEEQLYNLEYRKYFPFLGSRPPYSKIHLQDTSFHKLDAFHYALMTLSSLPTLLHYEDRNSMAHSIESRVPFLDHRLIEYGFALPSEFKIRDGYTKWVLRESMKGVLPEKIRLRTDKKGFVTPGEIRWLRGPLSHLLDVDYNRLDFLDKTVCRREIEAFRKGDNKHANLVWRLANLDYWIKNFL